MLDRAIRRVALVSLAISTTVALTAAASAQKKYDPGASDTEIKIGNIMPYSGPASAYGTIGKAQAAYFKKINDEGGITAARSISSVMTTPSVRRRPSSRRASWWRATRCCWCSSRSGPSPTRQPRNT
jgi:hypothetical protein